MISFSVVFGICYLGSVWLEYNRTAEITFISNNIVLLTFPLLIFWILKLHKVEANGDILTGRGRLLRKTTIIISTINKIQEYDWFPYSGCEVYDHCGNILIIPKGLENYESLLSSLKEHVA